MIPSLWAVRAMTKDTQEVSVRNRGEYSEVAVNVNRIPALFYRVEIKSNHQGQKHFCF